MATIILASARLPGPAFRQAILGNTGGRVEEQPASTARGAGSLPATGLTEGGAGGRPVIPGWFWADTVVVHRGESRRRGPAGARRCCSVWAGSNTG